MLDSIIRNISPLFRIDLRSLALLRIGMALIILCDLFSRVGWIEAFYTDDGFFTRELSRSANDLGAWSLYWLDGSVTYAKALLALTGVAAFCLLIGFRTRLASVACLILCYSLFVRMPLILDGGHVLLRMLLFWGMFLPLGSKWSVDSRSLDPDKLPSAICNFATAGILLQVAMMYFFSGLAKCNGGWISGDAFQHSMSLTMYAKPFGFWIASLPKPVLLWIGRFVLLGELLLPILIFVPMIYKPIRKFALVWFCGMHVAIWLTLSIGVFAVIAMVSWALFLPWKCPENSTTPISIRQKPRSTFYSGQIVCGLTLVFVVLFNVSNIENRWTRLALPQAWKSVGWMTMTAQEFEMFGEPPWPDPYVFVLGVTNDGQAVNLVTWNDASAQSVGRAPYPSVSDYPNHAWRRLLFNAWYYRKIDTAFFDQLSENMEEYLIERWNNEHDEEGSFRSATLTIY